MDYIQLQLFKKNLAFKAADPKMIGIDHEPFTKWLCPFVLLFLVSVSVRCYSLLIIGTNFSVTEIVFKSKVNWKTRDCTHFRLSCCQNRLKSKCQSLSRRYQLFISLLSCLRILNHFPNFCSAQTGGFSAFSDAWPYSYTYIKHENESNINVEKTSRLIFRYVFCCCLCVCCCFFIYIRKSVNGVWCLWYILSEKSF